MKTKSTLFRTTGVFLALLLSFALASPNALAVCGQCDDVAYELYYGTGNDLGVELVCEHPTGATIYYTITWNTYNNNDPIRDPLTNQPGANTYTIASGSVIHIPYGWTAYIRAFAWKSCWLRSVNITDYEQHNPNG